MNSIDKRKMVEGVLYNFYLTLAADNKTVDFCQELKDLARKHGYTLYVNKYRQIEIKRTKDGVHVSTAFII